MVNVNKRVVGSILHLEIDLSKVGTESASGKSIVIASTQGNQEIAEAAGVYLGVNVYKKKPV